MPKEVELFTYDKGGKSHTVCIGFTKIASKEMVSAVEKAIQKSDKNMWISGMMEIEEKTNSSDFIIWLIVLLVAMALALVVLIAYIVKKRNIKEVQNQTTMIDEMTGIGNLNYFKDCFSNHISSAMRPLYYVAYVAIQIEKIETYFGLQQSEELQRYVAATITDGLQDHDFAARIENGVFACCFMCPDTERAIQSAAELISNLNAYNESYAKDNGVVFRCGLYSLDKENIPCETVIYNARQGYLYAVNEQKDVYLCDKNVLNRVSLKSRLQKKIAVAIEKEEFKLYLQFVFDTATKRFCGAEVLTRWHSPEEGVLSPANYIEDMKLAGMIDKLDFSVLEKTCRILSEWKGTEFENLYLSCNITRTTLSSPKFAEFFEGILSKYDFDREKLLVELTEDTLVNDSATAYQNVLAIKKQKCKIALDDFGSGYTSFSDLCDYPLDIVKIDRHIVTKASSSRGYAVLVGIIRMAHALGIRVLCEGVEKESENQRVLDAGCDWIQGFMYARVLPLENAIDFYKTKQ